MLFPLPRRAAGIRSNEIFITFHLIQVPNITSKIRALTSNLLVIHNTLLVIRGSLLLVRFVSLFSSAALRF